MSAWSGVWTAAEATAYLENATVPIRLACRTPDGGLWMLSLWYRYRDGAFHCATGASVDRQTTRATGKVRARRPVPYQRDENSYICRGVRPIPGSRADCCNCVLRQPSGVGRST